MKLTEKETKLLMSVPMTFEILHSKMLIENIGTDERRNEILNEASKLRAKYEAEVEHIYKIGGTD